MKIFAVLVLAGLFLCGGHLFADGLLPVVAQNTNIVFSFPRSRTDGGFSLSDYELRIRQDYQGANQTSIFFNNNFTKLDMVYFEQNTAGADWYLVNAGDVFSMENILSGSFQNFIKYDPVPSPSYPYRVNIGSSDFYLGVATGVDHSGALPERNAFGWVHFANNGLGTISMIDNAVIYGSSGVIVGTTSVPEPSSLSLLLAGGAVLMAGRRRKPD